MLAIVLWTVVGVDAPVIVDSHIFAIDIEHREFTAKTLKEPIIDQTLDRWLYVLTSRYLHKIHPQDLSTIDRIPLPQRYSHLITGPNDIYLITANEIVVIDKSNLAFKSGIGIEYGDFFPVMMTQSSSMSLSNSALVLLTSSGNHSVLKILDLFDGRLIRKVTVDKIVSFAVDPHDGTLTAIDIKGNLTTYHEQLHKKFTIPLRMKGFKIYSCGTDFLVYTGQALFRINHQGHVIDFQPIGTTIKPLDDAFVYGGQRDVVCIDSQTLRIRGCSHNPPRFRSIVPFRSHDGEYVLTLDEGMHNLAILDCSNMTIYPLTEKISAPPRIGLVTLDAKGDSLWYFQLGAFSNHEYAHDMYRSFRQQSLPVFIDTTNLFRVKIGGFTDKEHAQELIEHAGLNGWFILDEKRQCTETVEFTFGPARYVFSNGIITRSE